MAKIAFVALTPYHLFNINNIILGNHFSGEAEIDLYILGKAALSQSDIIRSCSLFSNIYDLSDCFKRKEVHASLFRKPYLVWTILISQIHMRDIVKEYDLLFVTYPSIPVLAITQRMIELNHQIKIYMFEDGIATYNDFDLYRSYSTKFIYKVFFGFDFYGILKGVYVYNKQLMSVTNNIDLFSINVFPDSMLPALYYEKYKDEIEIYRTKKIIFFDEYLIDNDLVKQKREIELLQLICKQVGGENVIFKPHPRSVKYPQIEGVTISKNNTIPFEIIIQCMPSIENKILISSCSTACITPKLIFNKEPAIIILSRLFGEEEHILKIFRNTELAYEQKNKFKIPHNVEELIESLNHLEKDKNVFEDKNYANYISKKRNNF